MNRQYFKKVLILAVPILLISCSKENTVNPLDVLTKENLIKLNEGYIAGASAKIEIWGQKNFFTGYNKLSFVLYDSLKPGKIVTDAHMLLLPLLYSGAGNSATITLSPVENPVEVPVEGVFPGAIVFTRPTEGDNIWKLKIAAHNHDLDKSGEANFDINVDNSDLPLITSFKSQTPDSILLILALIEPSNLKPGINDIEFVLYRSEGNTKFDPEDTYSIEITPVMPGMVTDLSGNENPASIGNGHYKGKVNLSMNGSWDIGVLVKKSSATVSKNIIFKVSF